MRTEYAILTSELQTEGCHHSEYHAQAATLEPYVARSSPRLYMRSTVEYQFCALVIFTEAFRPNSVLTPVSFLITALNIQFTGVRWYQERPQTTYGDP